MVLHAVIILLQLPSPAGDVRLLVSHTATRPIAASDVLAPIAAFDTHSNAPSQIRAAGDDGSRETAAVLAALTASIHGASNDASGADGGPVGGVSALLAHLAARDAGQLRHVLPALTAALRSAMEVCLVESTLPPSGEGAAAGDTASRRLPRPQATYGRLRRILELVAAIAGNRGLPAEVCAGELLALTASVLLHALPSPGIVSGGAAAGSGAGAGGQDRKRMKLEADAAASTRAGVEAYVRAEVALRAYAAEVFSALVSRAAEQWRQVIGDSSLYLLDQLEGCIDRARSNAIDARTGVHRWETVFGALSGLNRLSEMPSDVSATFASTWGRGLYEALVGYTQGQVPGKEGGEEEVWHAEWARACEYSCELLIKRHAPESALGRRLRLAAGSGGVDRTGGV